jgi:translation initiation factor IF-3
MNPNKINEEITAKEVMLVGDNVEKGTYSIGDAMKMADDLDLDLVMVGKGDTPACKIIDYQKFLYHKNKDKVKPKKSVTKEIRFTPNTDENDFNFKMKHAENFLKKGYKVKAFVFFRGREMMFKDRGETLLLKFAVGLEEYGTPEGLPKMQGRKMHLFLKPINSGK